jgi:hypothetical protein
MSNSHSSEPARASRTCRPMRVGIRMSASWKTRADHPRSVAYAARRSAKSSAARSSPATAATGVVEYRWLIHTAVTGSVGTARRGLSARPSDAISPRRCRRSSRPRSRRRCDTQSSSSDTPKVSRRHRTEHARLPKCRTFPRRVDDDQARLQGRRCCIRTGRLTHRSAPEAQPVTSPRQARRNPGGRRPRSPRLWYAGCHQLVVTVQYQAARPAVKGARPKRHR